MNPSSHAAKSLPEITKREAILMVHIAENFPFGFVEEDVALSLGWSLEEVQDARRLCAAHGLLAEQSDPLEIYDSSPDESESVSAADLLSPEERDAARGSAFEAPGLLTVGEELSVRRALAAGKEDGCFTEEEADEALDWAEKARLTSILLDQVLYGYLALMGTSADGTMLFGALDRLGNLAGCEPAPASAGAQRTVRR